MFVYTYSYVYTYMALQTDRLTLARNDNVHTTHPHTHTHTCPHTHTCTHTHTAVTLCVYTMKPNESVQMTFPSGRFTTVTQIMEQLLPGLRMPPENADIFSIWLSSKHLRKLQDIFNADIVGSQEHRRMVLCPRPHLAFQCVILKTIHGGGGGSFGSGTETNSNAPPTLQSCS